MIGVVHNPRFRVSEVHWLEAYDDGTRIMVELDDLGGALVLSPAKARRLAKGLTRVLDSLHAPDPRPAPIGVQR